MRRLTRDRALTLGFVALSFVLAFWQHPGWATSDTKIDLHVDPSRFLHSVASVWTPTTDLGEVHSAQYSGYLWPMGPFFAALHSLGLGAWVVQRLWLGLMFALSVWGILRLLDLLIGRPRGIVHVVATAFYLLNPYTVVFSARTSITLLGYAAMPWLLIVIFHGVRSVRGWRDWRGWWWAAAFALILTSTGGGVNAAVLGWMLVGPLVLLIYEPLIGSVRARDSVNFLARAGVLSVLASLWWIVPLLVHVRYGIDFLQFTEQPRSIWATNSIPESLRLMGYWTSYIGVGFGGVSRPFFSDGSTMLFNPWVVGASLVLPALAMGGFVAARRWRYAPFLLALVIVGIVIMVAGFPAGTPMRSVMVSIYRHIFVLRFMRTTNKAAPLVALGLAALLGLAARAAWYRLAQVRLPSRRRLALVAAPLALAALIALAALPLIRGGALDRQLQWKNIPAAWRATGSGLDRSLPANSRALVLPGSIFAYYTWGGTLDPILPRLTDRPVAVRYETPYSDLHAVDLLTTVDSLVQQRRLLPGELAPLLRLMGVGAVVSGTDYDLSRSGTLDPAAAAGVLAAQGLATPSHSYGPTTSFPPTGGDIGAPVRLPQVRRYDVAPGRGLVHVDPTGPPTIVDGSAQGLADLGAFGALPRTAPLIYAGDISPSALQRSATQGADVVVTDSNRRRAFLPQFTTQDVTATLRQDEAPNPNSALVDPFAARGSDAQTVTVLQGARYLTAPLEPGAPQFPEHGPIAAFDGNPSTSWDADRVLGFQQSSTRWIEIGLPRRMDVPYVDVLPLSDAHGTITRISVNGRQFPVGLGWTRLPLAMHGATALRFQIEHVIQPRGLRGGGGGFREIRIPGVHVRQLLRPPVVAGRELAGRDLGHSSLSYVFERTTGDNPFQRDRYVDSPVLANISDRQDPEQTIDRAVFTPASRAYRLDAWVSPAVDAPDSALDRLAGLSGGETFDSSSRYQDQARYRASSAFDGRADTAWIADWVRPEDSFPWISWSAPRPVTVSRLTLVPPQLPVRRPTLVALSSSAGTTPPLPVGAGGAVVLPRAMRARAFRLTVLASQFPAGATAAQRAARAVGIGSLQVPGLAPASVPRSGRLHAPCGSVLVSLAGRLAPMRPLGTVADLDAGRPMPATGCGPALTMPAGIQQISSRPGTFSVDLLRLRSPAPLGTSAPAGGGSVTDPGHLGNASVDGVRVSLRGASWIVLGESFDQGWQARCDGRSLGPPRVIDGYANGWPAPGGCRNVSFAFGPQAGVRGAYVLSALACLALILFLLYGLLRRRLRRLAAGPWPALPDSVPQPMPLARAVAISAVATVPLFLIFALRTGLVIFPLLTFVLWRGFAARPLAVTGAVLLGIVVPLLYVITPAHNRGGFNFSYSTDLIWPHWVALAAIILLGLACIRMIAGARGARRRPGGPPRSDPEPATEAGTDQRELAGAGAR